MGVLLDYDSGEPIALELSSSSSSSTSSSGPGFFSSSVSNASSPSSSFPSFVVNACYANSRWASSSCSCQPSNFAENPARNSSSKTGCTRRSAIVVLARPSMTRHLRMKSRESPSMSFNRAFSETSLAVSGVCIALAAVGTLSPSKRGFSRNATRCFLDNSWRGHSISMSSAVIVSRMSCNVCRSESPGKRGIPLKISAKMQPMAHTSTVPE